MRTLNSFELRNLSWPVASRWMHEGVHKMDVPSFGEESIPLWAL